MLIKWNKWISLLLLIVVMLDPANKIFKLKEVLSAILTIIGLILFSKYKIKKKYFYVIVSYFFIPNLYSAFIVLIYKSHNFSFIYYKTYLLGSFFGLYLLNLNFIDKEELKIMFFKIMKFYSFLYLFIVIIYYTDTLGLSESIYQFTIEKKNMMISTIVLKDYSLYRMFYKTSPILLFYYSYLIYNRKIMSLLVGILLIISGTGANVLSLLLITLFYLLSLIVKRKKLKNRIIIFSLIGIGLIFLFKNELFSLNDKGNSIKYEHWISYLNHWKLHYNEFLFGSGIGSGFYSSGRDQIVYTTELTYLEIIRLYGIVVVSSMVIILIYPLKKLMNTGKNEWLFISYLAYLFVGGTNPLIIGSTGALVIILTYRLSIEDIIKK